MMNTEKSIGGRNWNVFLYTISQLPDYTGKVSRKDNIFSLTEYEILLLLPTVGGMKRWGLRATYLSSFNELDAWQNIRITT